VVRRSRSEHSTSTRNNRHSDMPAPALRGGSPDLSRVRNEGTQRRTMERPESRGHRGARTTVETTTVRENTPKGERRDERKVPLPGPRETNERSHTPERQVGPREVSSYPSGTKQGRGESSGGGREEIIRRPLGEALRPRERERWHHRHHRRHHDDGHHRRRHRSLSPPRQRWRSRSRG